MAAAAVSGRRRGVKVSLRSLLCLGEDEAETRHETLSTTGCPGETPKKLYQLWTSVERTENNCSKKLFQWDSPSHTELFTLSQCSSSGRILTSSVADTGSSSGKVSSRRSSGSCSCHVRRITKSTTSRPDTIVYSFHGSTFFCFRGCK